MKTTRSLSDRLLALAAAFLLCGCVPPVSEGEDTAGGETAAVGPVAVAVDPGPSTPDEYWPDGGAVPRMEEVDCGDIEGKSTKACYELNPTTDRDGDGYFADLDEEILEPYKVCFECGDGLDDKCICPSGYSSWPEDPHCDKYVVDDWNTTNPALTKFNYGRLFREYDHGRRKENGMRPLPPGPRFFWRIHPRQAETPFNGIDDDCDGHVDEAEPIYRLGGNNPTPFGFDITLAVNDKAVIEHADGVTLHAYRLDRLEASQDESDIEDHLRIGEVLPSPDCTQDFPYDKSPRPTFKLFAPSCMLPDTAYAVLIKLRKGSDAIACVKRNGEVLDDTYASQCSGYDNRRNRVVSEVYYAMTGFSERTKIVNKGFHEWYLSERGLVGEFRRRDDLPDVLHHQPFQPNTIGEVPYYTNKPDGTRYDCYYGEKWCSEFVGHLYDWDVKTVDEIIAYFSDPFGLESDRVFAEDPLDWDDPTWLFYAMKPGDYLAMNTKSEEGKKNHSGIVAGRSFDFSKPYTEWTVWRLHGNSGDRVVFDSLSYGNEKEGHYTIAGIGLRSKPWWWGIQ